LRSSQTQPVLSRTLHCYMPAIHPSMRSALRAATRVSGRRTFDIQWREAMMELLDQLESENPEDPTLAPQDLAEYSCIYIKYVQIYRKLEECYDQMVHPQKRLDIRKALESTIGRILELKSWMVKLNKLNDVVQLDDILVDLKLTPDVLEIPVPRYYVEDRAKVRCRGEPGRRAH
jgi:hypothetical protein